jgi:7-cyano-7-deazaguanine reductase
MADNYGLTKLGHKATPDRNLEVFPNRSRPGSLTVNLHCTEFTCRCPVTGQPDWAQIDIEYVPDQSIVESKSVKLYLETFREEGIFHEHLAQVILDDLVAALRPLSCAVTVRFNVRGGIAISATASYRREA